MDNDKKYTDVNKNASVVKEPETGMYTFSSQEEADLFRLKKALARTHMERFQLMCRLIRIGKMLSNTSSIIK